MPKPVVKWVGGKRQVMPILQANLPKEFNNYFEPFIGGGALFFELNKENSTINDFNEELTNLYKAVRDTPGELIESMNNHKNTEEYFYRIRGLDRTEEYKTLSDLDRASRMLFLNKTAFNGIYRVNSKNQFNVPYNKRENAIINYDEENILMASKLLKSTTILTGSFIGIKSKIKSGDFVFFDPPYVPLTASSSFVGYTKVGFDLDMQRELKDLCDYIDSIGAYFMLSNSYSEFIIDLYKNYYVQPIDARRSINANGEKRGKIKEALVKNY